MVYEFTRDNLLFSLCGLNCSLWPMFVKKTCSGCIKGSMCYNLCNIVPCSLEHGAVDYCFECEDYPCDKYEGIDENYPYYISYTIFSLKYNIVNVLNIN